MVWNKSPRPLILNSNRLFNLFWFDGVVTNTFQNSLQLINDFRTFF